MFQRKKNILSVTIIFLVILLSDPINFVFEGIKYDRFKAFFRCL